MRRHVFLPIFSKTWRNPNHGTLNLVYYTADEKAEMEKICEEKLEQYFSRLAQ